MLCSLIFPFFQKKIFKYHNCQICINCFWNEMTYTVLPSNFKSKVAKNIKLISLVGHRGVLKKNPGQINFLHLSKGYSWGAVILVRVWHSISIIFLFTWLAKRDILECNRSFLTEPRMLFTKKAFEPHRKALETQQQ